LDEKHAEEHLFRYKARTVIARHWGDSGLDDAAPVVVVANSSDGHTLSERGQARRRPPARWRQLEIGRRPERAQSTDKAKAYIGMDLSDPAPDFAMLAKSFGWYSEGPVTDPKDIGPAVKRAIEAIKREGRPALVDTIVRRRELTRFR
jgi:hypothetical protein